MLKRYQIYEDEIFPVYFVDDTSKGKLTDSSIALDEFVFREYKKDEAKYKEWQHMLGLLYNNRAIKVKEDGAVEFEKKD